MTSNPAKPTNRFEVIDLYRGFGAICIFVSHGTAFAGALWLPQAYLALDVFFVMSGFVIANGFDGPIGRGLSFYRFTAARFIRFYPAYLFALVLTVPLALLRLSSLNADYSQQGFWLTVGLELFMLPSPADPYGGHQLYPINGVAWSLFFEFIVNIFYFLLFPWLTKRGLQITLLVCAVLLVITRQHSGTLNVGYEWGTLWFALAKLSFAFFMGVYLRRHVYGLLRHQPGPWTGFGSIAVMLLLFQHSRFTGGEASAFFDYLSVFVVFPAIVILSAGPADRPWLARLGEFSGKFSYPTYLLQDACFMSFAAACKLLLGISATLYAPWIILPLLAYGIAAGYATDRWLEPRGAAWLRARLLPKKPAAVASSTTSKSSPPT